jgi:CheY-like chemotaxis protein
MQKKRSEEKALPLVLICEDLPFNLLQAGAVMKRSGYRVAEATNGREGYEKAVDSRPDLILMDVMMPVMDGLTSIKMLKKSGATKEIPIIVLTSLDGMGDCEKCLQAGADGYLTKPIDADGLRRVLVEITGSGC